MFISDDLAILIYKSVINILFLVTSSYPSVSIMDTDLIFLGSHYFQLFMHLYLQVLLYYICSYIITYDHDYTGYVPEIDKQLNFYSLCLTNVIISASSAFPQRGRYIGIQNQNPVRLPRNVSLLQMVFNVPHFYKMLHSTLNNVLLVIHKNNLNILSNVHIKSSLTTK